MQTKVTRPLEFIFKLYNPYTHKINEANGTKDTTRKSYLPEPHSPEVASVDGPTPPAIWLFV